MLSIYDFSNDNLEQFSKLIDLIGKDINIYLTQQVWEEVFRNRENKIKDALSKFKEINIQIPNLCKGYEEHKTLQNIINHAQTIHRDLLKNVQLDINTNNLHSDKLLNEIRLKSKYINRNNDIVNKAVLRFNVGNPPGKDKSYGDAINWELLLENIPTGEDLFFISSDKDYKSVLDENRFNQYLYSEWKRKKNTELHFYKSLTEYFKLHLSHIELQTEQKKQSLIELLSISNTFSATHSIIGQLLEFSSYTDDQVFQLLLAAMNDQVWKIINDDDIKKFYKLLLKDNIDKYIDKLELQWILEILGYKKTQ